MYLDKYTNEDLIKALEAESAKCIGEVKCALGDLEKALARLKFILATIHTIKDRKEER